VFWILVAVVVVPGVVFVFAGNRMRRRAAALAREPQRAQAVVTRVRRHWWPMLMDPLGGPVSRPVVRFTTPAGRDVEAEVGWSVPGRVPRAGEGVGVVFAHDTPEIVALDLPQSGREAGGPIVMAGGVALVVVGGLLAALGLATGPGG